MRSFYATTSSILPKITVPSLHRPRLQNCLEEDENVCFCGSDLCNKKNDHLRCYFTHHRDDIINTYWDVTDGASINYPIKTCKENHVCKYQLKEKDGTNFPQPDGCGKAPLHLDMVQIQSNPALTDLLVTEFYIKQTVFSILLDASSHLYNRLCPSVSRSVGWSVGRLVYNRIPVTTDELDSICPLVPWNQ